MRGKRTRSFVAIVWLLVISSTRLQDSLSETIFAQRSLLALELANAGARYYVNSDRVLGSGAVTITDSDGKVLYKSGDFIQLHYMKEENAHGLNGYDGWAWLDLEADPELKACFQILYAGETLAEKPGQHGEYYLRITGFFMDDRLVPLNADYAPHNYGDGWLVFDWIPLLERDREAQGPVVTVYVEDARHFVFDEDHPVRYKGKEYANLLGLLEANTHREDVWGWTECIRFRRKRFRPASTEKARKLTRFLQYWCIIR